MTRSLSHKLSFSATHGARYVAYIFVVVSFTEFQFRSIGWQRKCVQPISRYPLCMVKWYKKREMLSWLNSEGEHRASFAAHNNQHNFDNFSQYQACSYHNGCLGSRYWCSASFTSNQLRPPSVSESLYTDHNLLTNGLPEIVKTTSIVSVVQVALVGKV